VAPFDAGHELLHFGRLGVIDSNGDAAPARRIDEFSGFFDGFQTASLELLNGDTVAQIQNAIDAVDRAIADEKRAESTSTESRRLVSSASPGGA